MLAAGRASGAEVYLLAAAAGVVFGDVVRRGSLEDREGDPTDLWSGVAFAAILVAGSYDAGRREANAPFAPGLFLSILGFSMIGVGVAIRRSATHVLGANFSVRMGLRDDHRLIESGPYRFIRHPNYAGLLLVALGTALALASPLAAGVAVALWLPILLVRIAREEGQLAERFGEAYEAYRRRTWRLVPGLY